MATTALEQPANTLAPPTDRTVWQDARRRFLRNRLATDGFSYLLALRLVPLFPFWLVNLVPALFGMSLGAYVICTFVGILPGAIVYTSVGGGLGEFLDRGEKPDLHLAFQPHILLPLLGLGLLALVPVAYKRWKRKP